MIGQCFRLVDRELVRFQHGITDVLFPSDSGPDPVSLLVPSDLVPVPIPVPVPVPVPSLVPVIEHKRSSSDGDSKSASLSWIEVDPPKQTEGFSCRDASVVILEPSVSGREALCSYLRCHYARLVDPSSLQDLSTRTFASLDPAVILVVEPYRSNTSLRRFISSVIKICWECHLHDPPLNMLNTESSFSGGACRLAYPSLISKGSKLLVQGDLCCP
jgi:hypothetical protein